MAVENGSSKFVFDLSLAKTGIVHGSAWFAAG